MTRVRCFPSSSSSSSSSFFCETCWFSCSYLIRKSNYEGDSTIFIGNDIEWRRTKEHSYFTFFEEVNRSSSKIQVLFRHGLQLRYLYQDLKIACAYLLLLLLLLLYVLYWMVKVLH